MLNYLGHNQHGNTLFETEAHIVDTVFHRVLAHNLHRVGDLASHKHNHPRGLQPREKQRQRGETTINSAVLANAHLKCYVDPLPNLKNSTRDYTSHQSSLDFHLGVGHYQIEQRKGNPHKYVWHNCKQRRQVSRKHILQLCFYKNGGASAHQQQYRRKNHYSHIVGDFFGDGTRFMNIPQIVERLLDIVEQFEHRIEQHHHADTCDKSALCIVEHRG